MVPITFVVLIVIAAVCRVLSQPSTKEKSPGGARWAKKSDLKRNYLPNFPVDTISASNKSSSNPFMGYLGLLKNGKSLRIRKELRCSHMMIIGGTGARKTSGYHKPNMVVDSIDGNCCLVFDLKWPDPKSGFAEMIALFQRQEYEVQLFLPFELRSQHLPILAGGQDKQNAYDIAEMIVPDNNYAAGEFYRLQERDVLTGLILGHTRQGDYQLSNILKLIRLGTEEVREYIFNHTDKEVKGFFGSFFQLDIATRAGVFSGLIAKLRIFDNLFLSTHTSPAQDEQRNIKLGNIGIKKTFTYIGIPQDKLEGSMGKSLLQLIKRGLDLRIANNAKANGGSLPIHLAYYLDEFPNLGRLPRVTTSFATDRSRNISYHVTLQNRAQGEEVYGKTTFASMFRNNFQHVLFFPKFVMFEETAFLSEALGQMTVVDTARSRSRRHVFEQTRKQRSQKEAARPLLSSEEMKDWPDALGVWFMNDAPPTKVFLPRLDEKRVAGIKNPLYRFYTYFKDINLEEIIAEVLGEEVTIVAALPESTQSKSDTVFQEWVDKIVELEVPTLPYGHKGRRDEAQFKDSKSVTKVELLWPKEKLTQEGLMPDRKYLKDWEKRHLIKTKGAIGLLRPGMLVANSEAVSLIYASFGKWDESELYDKPETKTKLEPRPEQKSKSQEVKQPPKHPPKKTDKESKYRNVNVGASEQTNSDSTSKEIERPSKRFKKAKSAENAPEVTKKSEDTKSTERKPSIIGKATAEHKNELLAAFLMEHQLRLDGHPARKSIPEENRFPAIGLYRPAVHYYPIKSCVEIDKLKQITKRLKGKSTRVVVVPEKLALILNERNLLPKEKRFSESTVEVSTLAKIKKFE